MVGWQTYARHVHQAENFCLQAFCGVTDISDVCVRELVRIAKSTAGLVQVQCHDKCRKVHPESAKMAGRLGRCRQSRIPTVLLSRLPFAGCGASGRWRVDNELGPDTRDRELAFPGLLLETPLVSFILVCDSVP